MDVLLHPVSLFLIGVFSLARVARFLTFDDFPPVERGRRKIVEWLPEAWKGLMVCPFCLAPYLTAVQIAWFLSLYHADQTTFLVWWVLPNFWWAMSYAAAMIVAYDQPE
jgi:hypothetical protein